MAPTEERILPPKTAVLGLIQGILEMKVIYLPVYKCRRKTVGNVERRGPAVTLEA
jgi:hypothetical protein